MKKLAIFLLTVFTCGTAAICGCGGAKANSSYEEKIEPEHVKIRTWDENEQAEPECPDGECPKGDCPDGNCPKPRTPHRKHGKKLPRPKHAYRKNK